MAEELAYPSSAQRPAELYINPYRFLRSLHLTSAGLFTDYHVVDTGRAVLGQQRALRASPPWNNLLIGNFEDGGFKDLDSLLDQAEYILRTDGSKPAVYFPDGGLAEELHVYLRARGYKLDWTDAWMFANPERIRAAMARYRSQAPPTLGIRRGEATRRDYHRFLATLHDSRRLQDSVNNPYGELSMEELHAIGGSVWRLLQDGTRGDCFMVEKKSLPGMRRHTSVAAVATVSYIESFFGRIAHIENVGRVPSRGVAYKELGGLAVLAAAEAGLDFLARPAQPFVGPPCVVCLATAPYGGPYRAFRRLGFDPGFEAYGYVKDSDA